jgi:putative PIN family toxin of toxin-antitoxin system
MIRLVLDTNTLISAIGWRESKPRRILEACLLRKYVLVESAALLKEFLSVINRPKFSFIREEQNTELLERLASHCEVVEPKKKINIIKQDPADNKVLECALEGRAQYIITGDQHLLKLKQFGGTRIMTANEFLSVNSTAKATNKH